MTIPHSATLLVLQAAVTHHSEQFMRNDSQCYLFSPYFHVFATLSVALTLEVIGQCPSWTQASTQSAVGSVPSLLQRINGLESTDFLFHRLDQHTGFIMGWSSEWSLLEYVQGRLGWLAMWWMNVGKHAPCPPSGLGPLTSSCSGSMIINLYKKLI